MCDENIEIGVTEITNNILVSAQPTDQIIDINVLEEVENVELTITPSVVEVNIDVTQELITEIVTVDANTCVNIVDVTVTDATDNVTLNITPSLVEVNINRGENNLSIEEYESFADLPTIGDTDTYYITLDDNKFWRWDSIDEIYVEISDSNDKIPYLGAYKNSDLGEWGIKSNWFGLDLTPTNPPTVAGTITWNDTDGTADLILKGGNVTLQIGQEEVVRVVNKTGATLNEADFRAVRVRSVSEGGAQGQRLAVVLAQANNDANSATTIGLVTESISDNQEGFITTSGEVKKINTTGAKSYLGAETWVDGDILYLSPTHAGYLTNVKPQAPNHTIIIGWVVYAHANNGKIFVKVDNGYELDELHNVKITTPTNNQGLVYDSALSVWKNASIQLPLSATSPLSIASNVLSITKADATTDGYLSSADWNYFSAKQQPLFGTGFVKATGSVISYDNTVYTPQSRTLTINGTAYDLSADRSWSISVGSGMRNVSSFVATSGQTTFTIVGGYTAGLVDVFVNGARLNAGDYTATNGTTVVLGTGVVANDIVDIINYTASLTSGITGSGTANYIPKWSGSSNLTNSIIYDNGFVVGINTATPIAGSTLTVNGQVYSKNGAFWTEDGQGYLIGDLSAGASYAFMSGVGSTGAASYLTFHTNYYEKMRIIANGNVGIGLTNPAYKLDVSGDINITGSFRINGVAIGGGSGTVTGTGTTNYIAKWSGTSAITNSLIYDNGTNVGIGTTSPTIYGGGMQIVRSGQAALRVSSTGGTAGGIEIGYEGSVGGFIQTVQAGGQITFYTGDAATTVMRLTSAGRVGIGTTTPSTILDVNGVATFGSIKSIDSTVVASPIDTGSTKAYFNASGIWGASITSISDSVGRNIRVSNNVSGTVVGLFDANANEIAIGSNTSHPLTLKSVGVERIRINTAGDVGIGTSTPSYKLEVNGNIRASYNGTTYFLVNRGNTSSQAGYQWQTNGTTNWYNYTEDANNTLFWYGNGGYRMALTQNGQLLLGTTATLINESSISANSNGNTCTFKTTLNGGNTILSWNSAAGSQTQISFFTGTSYTFAGSISTNGTTTSYNTSSDYRLKEDFKAYNGLEIVNKIDTYNYQWKADKSRAYGVIAHELQEVLPNAVLGIKDGEQMQQVDYSKIVPVLVQAIKELNAKLEAK